MNTFAKNGWVLFCCLVGLAMTVGCKKPHSHAQDRAQVHQKKQHKHHGEEKDINRRFLDKKLDAKSWQKRFEDPKREVYQNRELIVEQIGVGRNQHVADIGAGSGAYLETFLKAIGPKGILYAVEISPNFVKFLNNRAKQQGYQNMRVVQSTTTSTLLPAQSIDIAFICDTYHHFDKAKEMLADLRKVLRPQGKLVIVDFKRIPGVSSPWILNHVKHDQAYVTREITGHGFVLEREVKLPQLKENYMLIFRRK